MLKYIKNWLDLLADYGFAKFAKYLQSGF